MTIAALAPVLDKLAGSGSPMAKAILDALRPMVDSPTPRGTMAQWFQARNGSTVHTIQVDGNTGAIWSPLSRTVDATSYRGKVLLNGSARDYRGMKVLAVSGNALIVADDWHTIAYVLEGAL